MATESGQRTKSARGKRDSKRASAQKHETGKKVAKKTGASAKGRRAVTKSKKQTGSVKRRKVERPTTEMASA